MTAISWRRKRKNDPPISSPRRHLPDELIEGILVRLPLKSFIRFQCVSKSWFNLMKASSLIFNSSGIKNDLSFIALCFIHKSKRLDSWVLNVFLFDDDYEDEKLSKRLPRFRKGVRSYIDDVLCDNREPDSKYPLPAVNFVFTSQDCDVRSGLELVGYCNGVMCLTDYDFILLVNPILKEVKKVSSPIKPSLIGFGFDDHRSMDFKVVRILVVGNRIEDGVREFEAQVYDVKRNAWRELGVYPLGFYNRVTCSTFFNGVIHWCVEIKTRCWQILTFNVATELFQLMELPQGWQGIDENTPPRFALFVLDQDSLAFVGYSIINSNPVVNVWIMNNKHVTRKSWMCLHSIRDVPQLEKPISIWKKNKLVYETKNGKLIMYDILKCKQSVMYDGDRFWRHEQNYYTQLKFEVEAGVLYGSSLISMNT